MKQFVKGQKSKLADITTATNFSVGINLAATSGLTFDISCFGVDANDKLSDDAYFIFYNQKSSPCGSITASGAQNGDGETFQINLDKLPATIRKLVFTATTDGAGAMSNITKGHLRITAQSSEAARFDFTGADFKDEKALIIGEIYFKDVWRFASVGQGFNGGLSALLKHFGGEEKEEQPQQTKVDVKKPESAPPVSLQKVVLDKPNQSHKVSLTKGSQDLIIVRAQWTDNNDGNDDNDDLDLRVGILFPDGRMDMIHADELGSLDSKPYIKHLGDVREPGEEVAKVRADISSLLGGKVALVFSVYSAVQNGAVSVASLKPKMRMEYGSQVVECVFDFSNPQRTKPTSFFGKVLGSMTNGDSLVYTYVIGLVILDGETVEIRPSGVVSAPMSEATPRLSWQKDGDVTLTMDGQHVFKEN